LVPSRTPTPLATSTSLPADTSTSTPRPTASQTPISDTGSVATPQSPTPMPQSSTPTPQAPTPTPPSGPGAGPNSGQPPGAPSGPGTSPNSGQPPGAAPAASPAAGPAAGASVSSPLPTGGGGSGPPPKPTPTPPPDCGQTGATEAGAPPGYVSDPSGLQGAPHSDYGPGLLDLNARDAFRASLPPGTDMTAVNDAIAQGCSASWIRTHLVAS
jgi:hypothetical protein